MKKQFQNERGMTLIEILAAITILSIIFISFMLLFPQMTSFNSRTETKLITMNLAKQELAQIQSLHFNWPPTSDQLMEININYTETTNPPPPTGIKRLKYQKKEYQYLLDMYINPDLENEGRVDSIALHKVHLQIFSKGNVISETYGYIEVRGN